MSADLPFGINKEPVSWATHFAGFVASVIGLMILVFETWGDAPKLMAMSFYGLSVVSVFGASSLYHFFDLGEDGNRWLRRIDHCAIFAMLAGCYTPVVLHLQDGADRVALLGLVYVLCLAGMIFKIVWIDCPDWLGASIYLLLAWMAVIPARVWLPQLELPAIFLLVGGGLAYTLGAVIFVLEKPDPWPKVFGHHEIWHVFVLVGAGLHYFFMWTFLSLPIPP